MIEIQVVESCVFISRLGASSGFRTTDDVAGNRVVVDLLKRGVRSSKYILRDHE